MLAAAAEVRRGSEAFFTGSEIHRCQMKIMGMFLLSPTTSSLLSSNHSKSISSSSTSSRKPKNHDASSSFRNIDDALASFNHMLHRKPRPCIDQFNKLLSAIARMRHYENVLSLSRQMELGGINQVFTIYCFAWNVWILGSLSCPKSLNLVFNPILSHFLTQSICSEKWVQ